MVIPDGHHQPFGEIPFFRDKGADFRMVHAGT
jgi:hypothetical protein